MAPTAPSAGAAEGAGSAAKLTSGNRRISAMAPTIRARRNSLQGLDPLPFRLLSCRPLESAFDVDMSSPHYLRDPADPGC